jgi:hypothetical protein
MYINVLVKKKTIVNKIMLRFVKQKEVS